MKKIIYVLPLFAAALLSSCNGETNEGTAEETYQEAEQPVAKTITYSINPSTIAVKWTAFKLAEKVGVNGEFKQFTIEGTTDHAASIPEMVQGAEISLQVASTQTGDEARDAKIINSFFGTMENTSNIVAKIISIEGENSGTAKVSIAMNNNTLEKELEWQYKADIKTFLIKGSLNVPDWNGQAALDALNKVCEEKHKGEGDKAITWPDVEVVASVIVDEISE